MTCLHGKKSSSARLDVGFRNLLIREEPSIRKETAHYRIQSTMRPSPLGKELVGIGRDDANQLSQLEYVPTIPAEYPDDCLTIQKPVRPDLIEQQLYQRRLSRTVRTQNNRLVSPSDRQIHVPQDPLPRSKRHGHVLKRNDLIVFDWNTARRDHCSQLRSGCDGFSSRGNVQEYVETGLPGKILDHKTIFPRSHGVY